MKLIIAIGLGSFIGGICRYLLSKLLVIQHSSDFPVGTFIVNLIGCFAIGIVFSLFGRGVLSEQWKLILATGVIGGFTTFSAFSIESIQLIRSGNFTIAFLYMSGSVIAGLLATLLAYQLAAR